MNKWEDQKKNQMKNIIIKIKTIISVLNSRSDNAEKQINEQETELMKITKMQQINKMTKTMRLWESP